MSLVPLLAKPQFCSSVCEGQSAWSMATAGDALRRTWRPNDRHQTRTACRPLQHRAPHLAHEAQLSQTRTIRASGSSRRCSSWRLTIRTRRSAAMRLGLASARRSIRPTRRTGPSSAGPALPSDPAGEGSAHGGRVFRCGRLRAMEGDDLIATATNQLTVALGTQRRIHTQRHFMRHSHRQRRQGPAGPCERPCRGPQHAQRRHPRPG